MIQRKTVTQVGVLLGMADSCRRLLLGTVGYCWEFSSFLTGSTGGRPSVDHAMKLDMAKEISMIQRTAKGKQARH